MCTVLLPPGVNPSAVNKYINIKFRGKHSLKTFEKRALSKMFKSNKKKMPRVWGKLWTKLLNDLYALFHQIFVGFSDNTGRDGCTFGVHGTIKHAYRPVVIKREGTKPP